MIQWEELGDKAPFCAPFVKVGLEYAKKYYQRLGEMRAYIVAMCKCRVPSVQSTNSHANPMKLLILRSDLPG